jgi:hypothetical protein
VHDLSQGVQQGGDAAVVRDGEEGAARVAQEAGLDAAEDRDLRARHH